MFEIETTAARRAIFAAICAIAGMGLASVAEAQDRDAPRTGQIYQPGIWIDPDGCEHWVMDDGAEGYMSPHRRRDGSPVCHRAEICGVLPTDQLFATDRSHISAGNRQRLGDFFQRTGAFGYLIYGHTDSRASDEYNIGLSERRAAAVANVARSAGVRVVDVKGFGERRPRATNGTAAGMAENRRVEIYCLR